MVTKGDWGRVLVNGTDLYQKTTSAPFNHKLAKIATQPDNVGIAQFVPGMFDPTLSVAGYRGPANPFAGDAHNILGLNGAGVGGTADLEYIISVLYGNNAIPAAGDVAGLLDATLTNYDTQQVTPNDVFKYQATFAPRGKRPGLGHALIVQEATAVGTITSAVFDRGAAAASGTTKGAIAHLHCITPAGVQASGTITFTAIPADADSVTIGDGTTSVTYTFKTAITAANHVLIGATQAATALNLYRAMIGSQLYKGTSYYAGTAKLPATMTVAKPAAAIVTITALLYGTAGNAYTLASAGGANKPTVSGATLAGGLAGDSYVVTIQSATSAGGAYTAFMTFVSTLSQPGGERLEIVPSALTTINRYLKVVATTAGSTSKPAFVVAFSTVWQN